MPSFVDSCSRTRRRWWRPSERSRDASRRCRCPSVMRCSARRCRGPSPTGSSRRSSRWAASGAPSALLGAARRLHDSGRLRRRHHPQPDVRGGVQRFDRPHRGGARRVRPHEDQLRGAAAPFLGGARPHAGDAPGQRRGHAVPLCDLLVRRRTARRRGGEPRHVRGAAEGERLRRDHDRDREEPGRSTTPRTTTSSTCRRTPAATAGSAGPGVTCPVGFGASLSAADPASTGRRVGAASPRRAARARARSGRRSRAGRWAPLR